MSTFSVILPAAGQSRRFRDKAYKKPFAPLAGRAVWLHSAERFMNRPEVKQVIVIVADDDREEFDRRFSANVAILGLDMVAGGQERADSVERALAIVRSDIDYVAVHDAARPCIADQWIDEVFETAEKSGAAILAHPVADTIKRVPEGGQIEETVDRSGLWVAQTPQVFRRQLLLDAYAGRGDFAATDDAQLVERLGQPVVVVKGSPLNVKVTTRDDLKLAEQCLKLLPKPKLEGCQHPFAADDLFR